MPSLLDGGGGVNSLIVAYYKVYKQQLEIANVSRRTIFRQLTAMLCRYKEEMIMGFDNKNDV